MHTSSFPSIIVSPAAKKLATREDIVAGLQNHRSLGSLPYGFVGRREKKFMVVTTGNHVRTFFCLDTEFEEFTKNLTLREINETTVNE